MFKYVGGVCITLVIAIAAVTTFLTLGQEPDEAITIELGIRPSMTPHLEAIEMASMTAHQNGQFSEELSQRLLKPHRLETINGFLADRCEVSQFEWEEFAEWTKRQPEFLNLETPDWLESKSTGHRINGRLESPASGVNFAGAQALCESLGGRLPYAEEFEAMASGMEGRLYPWGSEFHTSAWPFNSFERNASQSCGLHLTSSTPAGIHDLGNNAMEWSQGPLNQTTEELIPALHGAPAARRSNRALYALNAAWLPVDPELKSHFVGFRCIYDNLPINPPWRSKPLNIAVVHQGDYPIGLPSESQLMLFLANLPPVSGIDLNQLLHQREDEPEKIAMERCEVRRDRFKSFLDDPLVLIGMYSNANEPDGISYTPLFWEEQLERPSLPVYGVNWWAADAFARWMGGRLPTVNEWRQAAAGSEGKSYPWGMSYETTAASVGDDESGELQLCGTATGDLASGVADLGGNLSEWTRTVGISHSRLTMWVQGGNWLLPGEKTTKSLFGRSVPLTHQSSSIGFRVVYD